MTGMSRKCTAILLVALVAIASVSAEKKISFSADRMSGSAGKKNGKTALEGHATVVVGTLEITGDRIELSGKDFRFISASGNVSGKDTEKGYSFSADILTYDRDIEVASFRGNAKLMDTKNEVESSATIITYNQKTEVAFFQVDVKLKRRDIDCNAGFALYRRSLSLLDLTGNPVVVRDGDEFSADRIAVDLETERITLEGSVTGTLKDTAKESAGAGVDAAKAGDLGAKPPDGSAKPDDAKQNDSGAPAGSVPQTEAKKEN
jgi:lipopolysaccharide export system protein LptA